MPTSQLPTTTAEAIAIPGWIGTAVAIVMSVASPVYIAGRSAERIESQQAQILQLRSELAQAKADVQADIRELRHLIIKGDK